MNLTAFKKLYSEAEEALTERRLSDLFALTEAIWKDTDFGSAVDNLTSFRQQYEGLLHAVAGGEALPSADALAPLFRGGIESLQNARRSWLADHKETFYGRVANRMMDISVHDLVDQLQRTTRSRVGRPAYHQALDAAFGIGWCVYIHPGDTQKLTLALLRCDSFVRRTMVGALLMGTLDEFAESKVELLLALGTAEPQASDTEPQQNEEQQDEEQDLRARVAVALTLIGQRYRHFLPFYPELMAAMRRFLTKTLTAEERGLLLQAFVCQSLTDRVGQRVEEILPIVKSAFEKQQPRLGSHQDDEAAEDEGGDEADKSKDVKVEVLVAKLEGKEGRRFFRQMSQYAQDVAAMRDDDMDVNYTNNIHLKRFPFFEHPARWFYPFHTDVPEIQAGIHLTNGKTDYMTLNIMNHSRFCDSDRYSFASMMAFLRRDGHPAITDEVQDQLNQLREEDDDDDEDFLDADDLQESAAYRLNPFASFCQDCYRYVHSPNAEQEYPFLFDATDSALLPLLPLFDGTYTDFEPIVQSVRTLIAMGDSARAIVLLNHTIERLGATAEALALRGGAFMQQQQWRQAISDFQQSLIMADNDDIQLDMARCYEASGDWQSALPLLLHEEEQRAGEDADLIEEVARCLVQLERWDDAVQRFFQLELQGRHLGVSRRGIGWCSLHQGKYERAEQYYRRLIDDSRTPSWENLLNLGHALWLQGRTADALRAYRRSSTAFNRSKKAQKQHFRHWSEAFREDARALLEEHIGQESIALMQDAVALKG